MEMSHFWYQILPKLTIFFKENGKKKHFFGKKKFLDRLQNTILS